MRRGHSGVWRNDNPRHFRPRSGGMPHYRPPSRGYGHADAPRFQAPGPRPMLGPSTFPQNTTNDHIPPEHHDRQAFRGNRINLRRPSGRAQYAHQGQRNIFPLLHRMRQGDVPDHNSHQNTPNFYNNNPQPWGTINSMGDVDHRQQIPQNTWTNPPFNYENRSPTKGFRHQDNSEHNKIPQPDYTGHRPPASDHYGGNHGSTMDNSNTFSRSVDDTVNIVRKRLLNRESQPPLESPPHNQNDNEIVREPVSSRYSTTQLDQRSPAKKKSFKLRNMKSNCDKIKNKIVHQLFMMDKDRIHKLMDNPNSSSKFEYAISSLVTESQNSFNRHLRSVAEKSLCSSSSSEFIHDDNNTIYEDTFMKQMQCILDPQDTVLLEDIKPMVLAELSKVLQLDDLQYIPEAEEAPYSGDNQNYHDQYSQESYDDVTRFEPYSPPAGESANYFEDQPQTNPRPRSATPDFESKSNTEYSFEKQNFDNSNLFERRNSRKSRDRYHSRSSEERQRKDSRSVERSDNHMARSDTPRPLFDSNVEQLSDDEDPFAELDRQYHVAVDHNFIDNEYMSSPQPSNRGSRPQSPVIKRETISQVSIAEKPAQNAKPPTFNIRTPDKPPYQIKKEIENQLQDITKSPLKFLSRPSKVEPEGSVVKSEFHVMHELLSASDSNSMQTPKKHRKSKEDNNASSVNVSIKQEPSPQPQPQVTETTPEKSESSSSVKSLTPTCSRKRSTDQKPAHRKEKRKKSEPSQQDTGGNKQILNKNIIIHVSDCTAKTSDKSCFNVYFSKENSEKESSKDSKKVDSSDKKNSDKHVKRKEKEISSAKKVKEKEHHKEKDTEVKKKDSSSSSHSILSPTDVSNSSSSQTAAKGESQTKLKPIDIFSEFHKKPSTHLAHRNTANPATPIKTTPVELKPVVLSRKVSKRHIATQVARKCLTKSVQTTESKSTSSRFSQTEKNKLMTRGSQTEPVSFKPTSSKSTDPFERMKEIDMEIQALLQEKFKLYNSLENKDSGPNTMQSLGMAVLNVESNDSNGGEESISEDTIVDDFTSIPVEELEQIAMETVQEEQDQLSAQNAKRNRRQKGQNQKRKRRDSSQNKSVSTITSAKSKRATKTPNISLIEQIITDNRPLEDIISLDELESKPKKKAHKLQSKLKKKNSKKKYDQQLVHHDIKPCSVVLKREDFKKLLQKLQKTAKQKIKDVLEPVAEAADETNVDNSEMEATHDVVATETNSSIAEPSSAQTVMMVEAVINDIQFDMLDVSEDIVIGDVSEEKGGEKEAGERSASAVSEEIILDNSQSSMDEATENEGGSECKVYDYSADENLRRDSVTVSGNGDAVLAIECIENNFIAACLDGNVYYFSGAGKLLNTLRGSNLAVTCLIIVQEKYGTTVYTGSLDSRIRYYDLETGLEKGLECNVLSPIQTMDRAWDTVFVGTRTGFVLQFECKNNQLIPVSTVKFSEQSILALRALKEGPRKVLLVAARSEAVTVRDAQTGLLLRTLEGPKMTVYTLLFEDGKVYCGTSSHQIHVFDYASGSHIGSHSGGKGAVCLRATGGLVFAGCYDGCVYIYREGDPGPLAQLRGPSLMLLSLAVLDTKIIAGYKDRSLYIWKIPLVVLKEMIL